MISKKTALIVGITLLVVIAFFYKTHARSSLTSSQASPSSSQTLPDSPQVVSTAPTNLDGATIPPVSIITVTFDRPFRNPKEVNSEIAPNVDYTTSLSSDQKSVIFTLAKPLPLKSGYTLTIKGDSRFNATTTLGRDLNFKFVTIDYSGV